MKKTLAAINQIADIYRRKAERRHLMATLPFEEKIKIVEELREFAKATAPFRAAHRRKMATRRGELQRGGRPR